MNWNREPHYTHTLVEGSNFQVNFISGGVKFAILQPLKLVNCMHDGLIMINIHACHISPHFNGFKDKEVLVPLGLK